MTVWGKNHNPTLYIYWVIYLPITIFHNCCLSGPYLGKYKRDCNGTWFIDRWQYEEGHCTRTIILPSIFTELSPHNILFFIMDAYLSRPYLGKYKRDWNETWIIDKWQWEEVQCIIFITLNCIHCITELSPINHFLS